MQLLTLCAASQRANDRSAEELSVIDRNGFRAAASLHARLLEMNMTSNHAYEACLRTLAWFSIPSTKLLTGLLPLTEHSFFCCVPDWSQAAAHYCDSLPDQAV